jgi:chromate reductase, NAD(P)H dehydrogenase (quinone)
MKKTIAFAGSNSSISINHQIVSYVATLSENTEVIRLTNYETPIYSYDIEKENGVPVGIIDLNNKLATADRLIISVAEHNGNLTAFFKNIIDWLSRNDKNFLNNKDIILLSCSPGAKGAASSLAIATNMLPRFGAIITASISIANFEEVFKAGRLIDEKLIAKIKDSL